MAADSSSAQCHNRDPIPDCLSNIVSDYLPNSRSANKTTDSFQQPQACTDTDKFEEAQAGICNTSQQSQTCTGKFDQASADTISG